MHVDRAQSDVVMTSGTIDEGPGATSAGGRPPRAVREGFRVRIEGSVIGDRIYSILVTFFAFCVPALLCLIALEIAVAGWPAFKKFGLSFLTSSSWDPVNGVFGMPPLDTTAFPRPFFNRTDFWAQGLTFSLEFRF